MIASLLPYMPQKFVWLFSKKYVAGKNIEDAIQYCKELNSEGILITLDILGEFIKTLEEAEANKNEYLKIIDIVQINNIKGNYSLKPSMFGLLIDKEVCYLHIRDIIKKAAEHKNFVRIDMEDVQCTSAEIELYRKLKNEFPENVGLVLQAYLIRTPKDIEGMLDVHHPDTPLNFRLCKGIYNESKEVAFKKYQEVFDQYLKNLEFILQNNIHVGIATHDKALVEAVFELLKKYKVPSSNYEFQMLLGVTPDLRKSIMDKGHQMRVYVPFGTKWFAYCIRRLKENPKMAGMIIKAIFKRG